MKIPVPKATAIWLYENTCLTFEQIAKFCGMHEAEVKSIADDEILSGMRPFDPVSNDYLTKEEISRCEKDKNAELQIKNSFVDSFNSITKKKPKKYIPMHKRNDKLCGVLWLIRNYPEMTDAQMISIVGTTRKTVELLRNKEHPSIDVIAPKDPVLLGLCLQSDLDQIISKVKMTNKRNAMLQEADIIAGNFEQDI